MFIIKKDIKKRGNPMCVCTMIIYCNFLSDLKYEREIECDDDHHFVLLCIDEMISFHLVNAAKYFYFKKQLTKHFYFYGDLY
jgi:hypothetical protein